MKKTRTIVEIWCDICKKSFANQKCKICGKDICNNCARYLCKYNAPPPPPERSSSGWGIGSDYSPYSSRGTYEPVIKETLCTDCCEAFKMTIAVTAGQDKVDKKKVEKEIETKTPQTQPGMYS